MAIKVAKKTKMPVEDTRCLHCHGEGFLYFSEPCTKFPDNITKKIKRYWYCRKHKEQVRAKLPKTLRASLPKPHVLSPLPSFDNRILVGDRKIRVKGALGYQLAQNRKWPGMKDKYYNEMLDKDYEKLFLIYNVDGSLKKSTKSIGDALKVYDFKTDVLVYYTPDGDKETVDDGFYFFNSK